MNKFKCSNAGNYVLDGDGFFISYQPNPCPMGVTFFASDNYSDETALVVPSDSKNKWRILNGDFRKEYENAIRNGLKACIEVYEANISQKSSWSSGAGT